MAKINLMLSVDSEDAEKYKEIKREYQKDGKMVSYLFREMINCFIESKKERF